MTIKEFIEVDPSEFSRLTIFHRYQYNFLFLSPDKQMAVLHITDTDVCALRMSSIGVIKTREPLLPLIGSAGFRFFVEPRFEGVSVSRVVLRQPLRINDDCLVFYDNGSLSKGLGLSNFKIVPQEIEIFDSLLSKLTVFNRHVALALGFNLNEVV